VYKRQDISKGEIRDITKGITIQAKPLPDVMIKILNDGGLLEHFRKHGGFALDV
jgi:3-isopropylmalate/(R)-2-methylmalate dehydratase small subunit